MENKTEFDLNDAAAKWRNQMKQSPAFRQDDLAELESHMRDSTAKLAGRGLSTEEAWTIAIRRIGGGAALETEFAKVNSQAVWLDRVLWMLLGIQLWGLLGGLSRLVSDVAVTAGLIGVGYQFGDIGGFGTVSLLLPGSLFLGAQTLVFLLGVVGVFWFMRSLGKPFSAGLQNRPAILVLVAIFLCGSQLAVVGTGYAAPILWARWLTTSQYGGFVYSKSVASSTLLVVQIVALVALTFWLARRRSRQSC